MAQWAAIRSKDDQETFAETTLNPQSPSAPSSSLDRRRAWASKIPSGRILKEIAFVQRATKSRTFNEQHCCRGDRQGVPAQQPVLRDAPIPTGSSVACSSEIKRSSNSKPNPKLISGCRQCSPVVFFTDQGNRRCTSIRQCRLVLTHV
jgi:hypothetical protein